MPPASHGLTADPARYLRTLAHLRPAQLAFLAYRRVRPRSRPHAQSAPSVARERRGDASAFVPPPATGAPDALEFVGTARPAVLPIDWSAGGCSRLWRYHLHYFDFLHDPSRESGWKRAVVDDWIARVPQGSPDAWDPYPTSLRIVNWGRALDDGALSGDAVRESLAHQALWLETNVERAVLANHVFKNAKALVFAGTLLEGRDAERWRSAGYKLFAAQLREQFTSDGGHYERSPMYHAICLGDVLDIIALNRRFPGTAPAGAVEAAEATARAALDFLDAVTMPDGDIPLFNDAAFGIAPHPDELFAAGRRLAGFERAARDNTPVARALAATGYFVIRDGDDMLVIDCGTPGPPYQPGHAHCDALSFELALDGRRAIVDCGVRDYEAGPHRQYVRGTSAHNTLSIDGREQSEIWGAFRMGRRARTFDAALAAGGRTIKFSGAHDGFRTPRERIVHRRFVDYTAGQYAFVDVVEGRKRHVVERRIHFAPDYTVERRGDTIVARDPDGRGVFVTHDGAASLHLERVSYHPRFGSHEYRTALVLSATVDLPATLRFAIERLRA